MAKEKFISLYSGELKGGEQVQFQYRITEKGVKGLGLMQSNFSRVSVSFDNENDLQLNSFEQRLTVGHKASPKDRITPFEVDLKQGSIISGSIENLEASKRPINFILKISYEK